MTNTTYRVEVLKGTTWVDWSTRDSLKGAKIAAANARRSRHSFDDVRIVEVEAPRQFLHLPSGRVLTPAVVVEADGTLRRNG